MWWGLLVVVSLCSLFLGVMSFFFPRFGLRIGLRGTRLNILLSLLFIALGINGLIHQQNEPVAEQLNLIRTTMVQNTNNIYHYETAKFENGIAVLINGSSVKSVGHFRLR